MLRAQPLTIPCNHRRPKQVDDDDTAEIDDDNDDADEAGAGHMSVAPDAGAASTAAKGTKSVRMAGERMGSRHSRESCQCLWLAVWAADVPSRLL